MKCLRCGKYTDNENKICDNCKNMPIEDIMSRSDGKTDTTSNIGSFVDFNDAAGKVFKDKIKLKKSKTQIKNTIKRTAATLLITVIAIGVIFFGLKFGLSITPSGKICSALQTGDTNSADSIFKNNFDKSGSFLLNNMLKGQLDDSFNKYCGGEISYDVINNSLNLVEKWNMDSISEKIKTLKESLAKMKESKMAYNQGICEYDLQNYDKAIENFKKVVPEDVYYEKASEYLEKSVMVYRNDIITRASDYVSEGNYTKAIKLLESAEILSDDELITHRIDEYKKADATIERKTAINEADSYSLKNDYANAIKVLENAIDQNELLKKDTTMITNLKHYRDLFSEQFPEKMDEYIKSGDYTSAGELLHEAQLLIPSCEDVAIKETELKGKVPIYLDTLTSYNRENYKMSKGSAIDYEGIDHSSDDNYVVLTNKSTASYNISDSGYSSFSAKFYASQKLKKDKTIKVKITAVVGGDYRYKECEISLENPSNSISINVYGCSDIAISVEGDDGKVIMSNAKFNY